MSVLKSNTINHIIEIEGGYVNDSSDSGGETKYGITVDVARENGYTGNMIDLSRDLAFRIYEDRYWAPLKLDTIEKLSHKIAEELADTGVNMGIERAAGFLQRSLNVLNNHNNYFLDLTVDHDVGPATLRALSDYLSLRGGEGETVLYRMLNSLQGAFYVELAERREKDEKFIFGWLLNRVS